MASKFDKAVIDRMVELSPLDFDKAEAIAAEFDLKTKAVIASAVRMEGVEYVRKARVSKTGDPVVTKEDLVKTIAEGLGLEVEALSGLDKATKTALTAIVGTFDEGE